jgi:hypothetical protein
MDLYYLILVLLIRDEHFDDMVREEGADYCDHSNEGQVERDSQEILS